MGGRDHSHAKLDVVDSFQPAKNPILESAHKLGFERQRGRAIAIVDDQGIEELVEHRADKVGSLP